MSSSLFANSQFCYLSDEPLFRGVKLDDLGFYEKLLDSKAYFAFPGLNSCSINKKKAESFALWGKNSDKYSVLFRIAISKE